MEWGGFGSWVGEFWGLVLEVIVGAAGGACIISNGGVSSITNRKKVVTPYDL